MQMWIRTKQQNKIMDNVNNLTVIDLAHIISVSTSKNNKDML